MKAVILAGGLGKRLRPLTSDRPKPLVEVAGKPIIVHQLEWLKEHDITEVIICAGYLKEVLIKHLGSGQKYGVHIAYVVEEEPLGTGGALANAAPLLRNEEGFFVLNGDIITDLDPWHLTELEERFVGSIALVPLPCPYGVVELGPEGEVRVFYEKPVLKEHLINAGVYFFRPDVLPQLPTRGDLERTTLPMLAMARSLKGVVYEDVFWKAIDTVKDVEEAERRLCA